MDVMVLANREAKCSYTLIQKSFLTWKMQVNMLKKKKKNSRMWLFAVYLYILFISFKCMLKVELCQNISHDF